MSYRGFNKVTLVLFAILSVILLLVSYSSPFAISRPQLIEGWQQVTSLEKNKYTAHHEIDHEMCGRSISFMTDSEFVDAYIGKQNIYHFGKKPLLGGTPGNYQHIIDIPMDSEGKTLTIEVSSVGKEKVSENYQYLFGDSSCIVRYLTQKDMVSLVGSVIMFFFAGVLFVLHVLGRKDVRESSSNVWLGMLGLNFCFWTVSRTIVIQLWFHNSILQYYLTYVLSFLSPLLLINYLKSVFPWVKAALEYLCNLLIILICVVCHFLNIWKLNSSSRIFALVMFLSILSLFVKVGYQFYQEQEWSFVKVSLMVFLLCLDWNAFYFFLGIKYGGRGYIIQFGLLVYILAALVYGAQKIIISAEDSRAAEVYKEMAYTDNLTKLQNRHALRRNVAKMQLKDICVVSMDLNNLKYYNDNLGHAYGDKLLTEAARVIQETYKDCYRTGGDEFVAILQKVTREQADSYRNQLIRSWKEFNESQDEIVLEIASGNGFYNVGDESYEDIMKRADGNMYYDKIYLKKHSKIKSTR